MPAPFTGSSFVRVTWECGACGHRFTSVQTADQTDDLSLDPSCPECGADNPTVKKEAPLENWDGKGSDQLEAAAGDTAGTLRRLHRQLQNTAATLKAGESDAGSPSAEAARRQFRTLAQKLEKEARRLRAAASE